MNEHRLETLLVAPSGPTTVVTINRPDTLNSLTEAFVHELHAVLDDIATDMDVRAVVLTGAGRGFSSGIDLSGLSGQEAEITDSSAADQLYAFQTLFTSLIPRITSLPQPVIAAVNGPATGAGLGLAVAADIRLCSESARFSAAFVRLGLSGCEMGLSYLLPRLIGPTLAFEMMLTGRMIDASEAHRCGLVLDVVADGLLITAALELADRIARNSPFGVRMTKEVMRTNLDAPHLQAAMQLENRTQILCFQAPDAAEAMAAFVERRDPAFGGGRVVNRA